MNKTKDGVMVMVGQVWRDLDRRMYGRTCEVIEVADGKATMQGVKRTKVSISRMHYHHNGWELVK